MSSNNSDSISNNIKVAQRVAICLIIAIPATYMIWFGGINDRDLSLKTSDWGGFGDFVGGILNPIVAFFAFYWLTKSVLYQKEELYETRIALIDSKDAQVDQARFQYIAAKLSALDVQLSVLQSDIENTQSQISYFVNAGLGAKLGFLGEFVDSKKELKKLIASLSQLHIQRSELQDRITSTLQQLNSEQ